MVARLSEESDIAYTDLPAISSFPTFLFPGDAYDDQRMGNNKASRSYGGASSPPRCAYVPQHQQHVQQNLVIHVNTQQLSNQQMYHVSNIPVEDHSAGSAARRSSPAAGPPKSSSRLSLPTSTHKAGLRSPPPEFSPVDEDEEDDDPSYGMHEVHCRRFLEQQQHGPEGYVVSVLL